METIIRCGRVFTDGAFVNNTDVVINDGVIAAIQPTTPKSPTPDYDFPALTLLPGFIDIHTRGAGGRSVMDCEAASIEAMAAAKLKEGVTYFCPTTETATIAKLKRALFAIKTVVDKQAASETPEGAAICGAFMEGPFHGQEGRHPRQILREPTIDLLTAIIDSAKGAIESVLIAPEAHGAAEAARFLAENGVKTRFGHTAASFDETDALIGAGASCCVHIFLHTPDIKGAETGAAGAALLRGEVFAEIAPLCDDISPPAVLIASRLKLNKLICVTDGAREQMNRAVTYLYEQCGLTQEQAITAATSAPAEYLGRSNERGSIAAGKRADLTALDGTGAVAATFVGGKLVYARW